MRVHLGDDDYTGGADDALVGVLALAVRAGGAVAIGAAEFQFVRIPLAAVGTFLILATQVPRDDLDCGLGLSHGGSCSVTEQ
jgi:hypothetical protein